MTGTTPKTVKIETDRTSLEMTAQDQVEIVRQLAIDPRLGSARIQVLEADTGRPLVERAAHRPGETASVMKTITCGVALATLGPDYRIETRVVRGSSPGEIVLVGGGDVTLSRVADEGATYYESPARLHELARLTLEALSGVTPSRIVLDDSLFAGGEWPGDDWYEEDRDPGGYVPLMSSLQVDGDREDPVADDSPRSLDPTGRAGAAFAAFLSATESYGGSPELTRGTAPEGAELLASVSSAPVEALVRETLRTSDNALAEALARLSSRAVGDTPDFEGLARSLKATLVGLGVPVDGMKLVDGSGLSESIRIEAATVADLLRRARLREGMLGLLDDRLTRTGPRGTIASSRFTDENAIVGDAVRAKTGFINTVHSLAGIVRSVHGKDLVFAVFAMGKDMDPDSPAKPAVDDFVTSLHLHGDALLALDAPLELAD